MFERRIPGDRLFRLRRTRRNRYAPEWNADRRGPVRARNAGIDRRFDADSSLITSREREFVEKKHLEKESYRIHSSLSCLYRLWRRNELCVSRDDVYEYAGRSGVTVECSFLSREAIIQSESWIAWRVACAWEREKTTYAIR